ncbi:MAG: helix-turn-helix domain-containing protein [Flavobacteriaceae bacterium]
MGSNLPAVIQSKKAESDFSNEREILYKVLFDMQRDITDLKKLTMELMNGGNTSKVKEQNANLINKIYATDTNREAHLASFTEEIEEETPETHNVEVLNVPKTHEVVPSPKTEDKYHFAEEIEEEESLSLQDKELELIKKSLEKYDGKRKEAANELGISERTLYRKIKQYNL